MYASAYSGYKLGDNIGFPMDNTTDTVSGLGSIVIPQDLTSNVTQLHEFLFGTTGYIRRHLRYRQLMPILSAPSIQLVRLHHQILIVITATAAMITEKITVTADIMIARIIITVTVIPDRERAEMTIQIPETAGMMTVLIPAALMAETAER